MMEAAYIHRPCLSAGECTRELLESADRNSPQPKVALAGEKPRLSHAMSIVSRLSSTITLGMWRQGWTPRAMPVPDDIRAMWWIGIYPISFSNRAFYSGASGAPPLDSSFLVSFDWGSGECGGEFVNLML